MPLGEVLLINFPKELVDPLAAAEDNGKIFAGESFLDDVEAFDGADDFVVDNVTPVGGSLRS